jgi:hypothetical protein
MRVFERSMHGGLGLGNVGAVVSRPGVGKKALLVTRTAGGRGYFACLSMSWLRRGTASSTFFFAEPRSFS